MKQCDTVIVTDFPIAEANAAVKDLIARAEARGILRRE